MPLIRVAPEHVARNPIARAVARQRVLSTVRDFLIGVYTLEEGSRDVSSVMAAADALAVACRLAEVAGQGDGPDARVMLGALSALAECSERDFRWRTSYAVPVDAGLSRASDLIRAADPVALQQAWMHVRRVSP